MRNNNLRKHECFKNIEESSLPKKLFPTIVLLLEMHQSMLPMLQILLPMLQSTTNILVGVVGNYHYEECVRNVKGRGFLQEKRGVVSVSNFLESSPFFTYQCRN